MKETICNLLFALSALMALVGLVLILVGSSTQSMPMIVNAFAMLVSALPIVGFAYVVKAACIYIDKNAPQSEAKANETEQKHENNA